MWGSVCGEIGATECTDRRQGDKDGDKGVQWMDGWMDGTAADADSVVVLICCTFLERVWVK